MANRIDTAELSRAINGWTAVVDAASWPTGVSTLSGGMLKSQYTVNGVERVSVGLQVVKRTDWNYTIARLYTNQIAGGTDTLQNNYFDFLSNGNFIMGGRISTGGPVPSGWWQSSYSQNAGVYMNDAKDGGGVGAITGVTYAYYHNGGYNMRTIIGALGTGTSSWAHTAIAQYGDAGAFTRYWLMNAASGDLSTSAGGNWAGDYVFQKAATSDATLKHDIVYDEGEASYENIRKLRPCTFVYNADYFGRVRRGIIAQDALRDIDREYVKLVPATPKFDEDGNRCDGDDTLALDNNVIMMDTALALHHAIAKIEALTTQVAQLQSEVQALKA